MRRSLSAPPVLVLLLIFTGSAQAKSFYSSPSGSGAQCSKSVPCSVTKAVEKARDGDKVKIASGTYDLTGDGLATVFKVTIQAKSKLRPPTLLTDNDTGVFLNAFGAKLEDVVIRSSGGTALLNNGSTVDRVQVYTESGLACGLGDSAVIRDSLCISHDGQGLAMGVGGSVDWHSDAVNVTAVGLGATGIGVLSASGNGAKVDLSLFNVIAYGQSTDIVAQSDSDPAAVSNVNVSHSAANSSNLDGTGTSVGSLIANGNILGDPAFIDPATDNARQTPFSPTIDAGTTTVPGGVGRYDFEYKKRVQGGLVDIGYDEFDSTPPKTKIKAGPPKVSSKRTAKFKLASNELGVTYQCKLDDRPWGDCGSKFRYTALVGSHKASFRALDRNFNVDSTPAVIRWRVTR